MRDATILRLLSFMLSERQHETSCITMRNHVVLKTWGIYWKFLWCKRNNWIWVRYKSFDITQSSNRFVYLLSHKNISQWGEISFDFAFLSSHPCGFFTIFFHTTMVKNLKKYIRKFRWVLHTSYSKASRYTASSCTDLAGAHFWIGSKKIWDELIYEVKTLSSTVFWSSCLHPIKFKSCTNFELHEFFLFPKNVHLKALLYS